MALTQNKFIEPNGLAVSGDQPTKSSSVGASEVNANTAKVSYPASASTKLATIAENAEVNTINTKTAGEPTGSDLVLNVISLLQAEYDAGTPVATTLYVITDA